MRETTATGTGRATKCPTIDPLADLHLNCLSLSRGKIGNAIYRQDPKKGSLTNEIDGESIALVIPNPKSIDRTKGEKSAENSLNGKEFIFWRYEKGIKDKDGFRKVLFNYLKDYLSFGLKKWNLQINIVRSQ